MKTISSQRYLDGDTVAQKIANEDYIVTVSPVFVLDGEEYRVVIDGHHSLAAARADGVAPIYRIATEQECDRIALLEQGRAEEYLEASWVDSDWYDVDTGVTIW